MLQIKYSLSQRIKQCNACQFQFYAIIYNWLICDEIYRQTSNIRHSLVP